MEVCYCFTVAIGTKGRQLQRVCKIRWLSSKATVGAGSEILAIWAALKQLSENKNDAMFVASMRLRKTKSFNVATSPDKTERNFQAECFNFAQINASVELCINKLSDAASEYELKATCEKFDRKLG